MEGVQFSDPGRCPRCGGQVRGYDIRERIFVSLVENKTRRDIRVKVKRFECRECGKVSEAKAPFYPFAHYGAPVVDFAIGLSRIMPYRRAAKVLRACHIDLNWGTIRLYSRSKITSVPSLEIFGIPVPVSLLNLSILGTQLGQFGTIVGAEAFAACCPPPADRTPLYPGA
jgi:endogenous inhibitor of DNA gyrase (YacG/DUF329 family)